MKRRFESGTIRRQRKESTVAAGSGVASYGGTGARAPSNLGNSVHSASAASLTIKNYQRKTCSAVSSISPETR